MSAGMPANVAGKPQSKQDANDAETKEKETSGLEEVKQQFNDVTKVAGIDIRKEITIPERRPNSPTNQPVEDNSVIVNSVPLANTIAQIASKYEFFLSQQDAADMADLLKMAVEVRLKNALAKALRSATYRSQSADQHKSFPLVVTSKPSETAKVLRGLTPGEIGNEAERARVSAHTRTRTRAQAHTRSFVLLTFVRF